MVWEWWCNTQKDVQGRESLPEELSSGRTDLHQPAGQPFSFHHRRGRGQFVPLRQPAGDPGGRGALPGRDDDAHAVVTAPPHRAAPGVHHEAHQESAEEAGERSERSNPDEREKRRGKRLVRVETLRVDVGEEEKLDEFPVSHQHLQMSRTGLNMEN